MLSRGMWRKSLEGDVLRLVPMHWSNQTINNNHCNDPLIKGKLVLELTALIDISILLRFCTPVSNFRPFQTSLHIRQTPYLKNKPSKIIIAIAACLIHACMD